MPDATPDPTKPISEAPYEIRYRVRENRTQRFDWAATVHMGRAFASLELARDIAALFGVTYTNYEFAVFQEGRLVENEGD